MRELRLRGLSRARDEFHLAAIVQNLKTLASQLWQPPPDASAERRVTGVIERRTGSKQAIPIGLPAALYAPLRVVLFEDEHGRGIFEYDRPSSFFSQYGDERVTEVGCYLDATLEAVLRNAAE